MRAQVVDMAQPLQPKEVRKPGSNIGTHRAQEYTKTHAYVYVLGV